MATKTKSGLKTQVAFKKENLNNHAICCKRGRKGQVYCISQTMLIFAANYFICTI